MTFHFLMTNLDELYSVRFSKSKSTAEKVGLELHMCV